MKLAHIDRTAHSEIAEEGARTRPATARGEARTRNQIRRGMSLGRIGSCPRSSLCLTDASMTSMSKRLTCPANSDPPPATGVAADLAISWTTSDERPLVSVTMVVAHGSVGQSLSWSYSDVSAWSQGWCSTPAMHAHGIASRLHVTTRMQVYRPIVKKCTPLAAQWPSPSCNRGATSRCLTQIPINDCACVYHWSADGLLPARFLGPHGWIRRRRNRGTHPRRVSSLPFPVPRSAFANAVFSPFPIHHSLFAILHPGPGTSSIMARPIGSTFQWRPTSRWLQGR